MKFACPFADEECKELETQFKATQRGQGPWGHMYRILFAKGLKSFMDQVDSLQGLGLWDGPPNLKPWH